MARLFLSFGVLVPLIQVACAIHAYKSGKERWWLWIILMFPLVGCGAYLLIEVLPTVRRTGQLLLWLESIPWFRGRELDRLEDDLEDAPTTGNRLRLADACVRHGRLDRAAELYRDCLKGPHEHDVHTMRSLAEVLNDQEDWKSLLNLTVDLRPLLPDREINDAIRWEAIALDGLGRHGEAEERYLHLMDSWPGEEIRCRLASMLARQSRYAEARKHFETVQRHIRRGGGFYRSQNKAWEKSSKAWLKYIDEHSKQPA